VALVRIFAIGLTVVLLGSAALAGAPLKGIDVKLGKSPGGTIAARVTDENGMVDFGVLAPLPVGQTYTLRVGDSGRGQTLTVSLKSGTPAPIVKEIDRTSAVARAQSPDLTFVSDGKKPLIVAIAAGRVKSHSNSTNN
jgi:hypothetical protein